MSEIEIQLMRSVMVVTDVNAAVAFWQSIGLSEQWRQDGEQCAVGMGGESLQIMLLETSGPDDMSWQNLYVTLRGVDAMHARCLAAQPDATGPIGDRPYGMRDFSVIDPWGHRVVFGEHLAPPS